jgi:hypothetical protein
MRAESLGTCVLDGRDLKETLILPEITLRLPAPIEGNKELVWQ